MNTVILTAIVGCPVSCVSVAGPVKQRAPPLASETTTSAFTLPQLKEPPIVCQMSCRGKGERGGGDYRVTKGKDALEAGRIVGRKAQLIALVATMHVR
jgi:hypothetical protein